MRLAWCTRSATVLRTGVDEGQRIGSIENAELVAGVSRTVHQMQLFGENERLDGRWNTGSS